MKIFIPSFKTMFLIFACFSIVSSYAQSGYRVVYSYAENNAKDTTLLSRFHRYYPYGSNAIHHNFNVIFNDSLAYFSASKPKKKDNVYGLKPMHHDSYYDKQHNKTFSYVKYPNPKAWLVIDTPEYKNFIAIGSNINVQNFDCQLGYFLQNSDTVFALIALNIPYPYGPYGFIGLPGLVVEIFYPKYGAYFTLNSFKEEILSIKIPAIRQINWVDYRRKYR